MTTVVLLVLALAWGAVLYFWFRSRSQGSFSDSVGLFHRHLHVLERAAPVTYAPANRLRSPYRPPAPLGVVRSGHQTLSSRPRRPTRTSGSQVVANARRRQTQRRRRDVLFVLGIVALATFVIAAFTRRPDIIVVQVFSDIALGSYVALLVRLRDLAAERELTFRTLDRSVAPARSRRPAARSARPSARPALTPAYALASGYGATADPFYGRAGYGEAMRGAVGNY